MSEHKHTPGPWEVGRDSEYIYAGIHTVCRFFSRGREYYPDREANAVRIVACVNAFEKEGIEDPEEWMHEAKEERRGFWYEECKRQRSELGGEIARLREEIAELKKQQ